MYLYDTWIHEYLQQYQALLITRLPVILYLTACCFCKVLTNANKRRLEELHRQQCLARRMGAGAEVDDPPLKFVVEVRQTS